MDIQEKFFYRNSNVKDQSTEAKSQIDLISREPISLKTENDIKMYKFFSFKKILKKIKSHGSAKISGRHTNTGNYTFKSIIITH